MALSSQNEPVFIRQLYAASISDIPSLAPPGAQPRSRGFIVWSSFMPEPSPLGVVKTETP